MTSDVSPDDRLTARLPAVAASVPAARAAVASLVDRCGADPSAVALCVSEAVTNAVLHAYRDQPIGDLHLHGCLDERGDPSVLHIAVEDDGIGMLPRTDSPGLGLGLSLIATMAASVEIRDRHPGCTVHMTFRCRSGPPPLG